MWFCSTNALEREATGEDISTRAMMEYFKAADELAGGTKQRPPDRLGLMHLVSRGGATSDRLCARSPYRACDESGA